MATKPRSKSVSAPKSSKTSKSAQKRKNEAFKQRLAERSAARSKADKAITKKAAVVIHKAAKQFLAKPMKADGEFSRSQRKVQKWIEKSPSMCLKTLSNSPVGKKLLEAAAAKCPSAPRPARCGLRGCAFGHRVCARCPYLHPRVSVWM